MHPLQTCNPQIIETDKRLNVSAIYSYENFLYEFQLERSLICKRSQDKAVAFGAKAFAQILAWNFNVNVAECLTRFFSGWLRQFVQRNSRAWFRLAVW